MLFDTLFDIEKREKKKIYDNLELNIKEFDHSKKLDSVNIEYIDFIHDFLDRIDEWKIFKINKKYTLKLFSSNVKFKERRDENMDKLLFDIYYYTYSENLILNCRNTDKIYEMTYESEKCMLNENQTER
jgi:hypothetical protein